MVPEFPDLAFFFVVHCKPGLRPQPTIGALQSFVIVHVHQWLCHNREVALVQKGRENGDIIYHRYDAELHIKIAKYTCENGNKSTVETLHYVCCCQWV
jgi:hypothetical protein